MVEVEIAEERGEVRAMLIEAASRLLREQGARAVTTRAVAQAAGVQPPMIYRHFHDKDGLLDALAEHAMVEYVHAKSGPEDADPLAELRTGWAKHVEFGLANSELYLLINTPGRRSAATDAGRDVLRHRVHRLAEAGLLRVDEARATEMIHAAGTGAVVALLSQPPDSRDPDLAAAMFDAVAAAILTDRPPTPAADVLPLTVTFATAVPGLPTLSSAERSLMSEWLARAISEMQSPSPAA
ncbi:TetR/AcrR family transcriptional regulator [Actinoplanes sp. L3-i22]|uniref:TetR/AcrR family transcriptional regulator n=1 Tax=Actinoplanes sp. L3-i22 TaxID=2836373 RepID=UPI001C74389A|nr:TetR/AcrR family transcriptional regulator [Actinoplanes sp. L3-i22]BCY14091.1 TetR family transcriptional regulator [Actinoplanes sp. L3-i22]